MLPGFKLKGKSILFYCKYFEDQVYMPGCSGVSAYFKSSIEKENQSYSIRIYKFVYNNLDMIKVL